MKNVIASVVVTIVGLSAFAENSKVGVIRLSGSDHQVTIQERGGTGTITIGTQVFKITGGGNQSVEGVSRETNNGNITKDVNVLIAFKAVSNDILKQTVDNKNEVNCNSSANAVAIISNNKTGALIGNCLTLTSK